MASITPGRTFTAGTWTATDLNEHVSQATISGLTATEFAAASVDGADATASLRRLVTDGTSTTAGKALGAADPRVSKLTAAGYATADKIATSGTAVTLSSTAPTNGQVLTATSATTAAWSTPGAGVEITGTGTISSSGAAVTGVGTAFTSELKVGDLLKADSIIRTVTSITNDTSLTIDQAPGAAWSADAFTFIQSANTRPWNVVLAKSGDYTVLAADKGTMVAVDSSAGAVVITLCAVNSVKSGDSISVRKTTDDANAVTVTCAGSDTIDDASTTVVLKTYGASVTLISNAVSKWHVGASHRLAGRVMQRARTQSTAQQTVATTLAISGTPTTANTTQLTGLTATITPKSQVSVIKVRGKITGTNNNDGQTVALCVFSTVGGVATLRDVVAQGVPQGGKTFTVPVDVSFTSGTTSALTIDVYAASTAGTFYHLGTASGGTLWGGNARSVIEVIEEAI